MPTPGDPAPSVCAVLLVLTAAACARPVARPVAIPQHEIAPSSRLRFASLAEVPTGTYVALRRPDRRFALAFEGGRLHLDTLRPDGAVRDRYELALSPSDPTWLTVPGHYGVAFARVGPSLRMDILFCYERVVTVREPSPR